MAIKWGTDSKVRYIDPESGIPLELGASGSMNLMVSDSRKLLVKLVGTMRGIAWDTEASGFTKSLQACFRPLISMAVKSNLSAAIKARNFDIFEIDEHLSELSDVLHEKIEPGFEDYGLTIPRFYLTTVVLPEEDANFRRLRDLHTVALQSRAISAEAKLRAEKARAEADVTAAQRQIELERQTTQTEVAKREAERRMIEAQTEAMSKKLSGFAEAEVMQAMGYNQKDVLQADVQKAFAQGLGQMGGSGGSSTMGDILGLGLGIQAAGAMGGKLSGLFDGLTGQNAPSEPKPAAPADDMASFKAKLEKLTMMQEAGLLSAEEFASMKAELLKSIL